MEAIARQVRDWVEDKFFSDKVYSCLQTLYYAVAEKCIEEDGKRKWGNILIKEVCFTEFFEKVIQTEHETQSLPFVCGFLRNLIEFANEVSFPQRRKLETWLKEKDNSPPLPILLRQQRVDDILELLQALQETTIPELTRLSHRRKPKSIESLKVQGFIDLLLSLSYLRKKLQSGKKYQEAFFLNVMFFHLMRYLNRSAEEIESISRLASQIHEYWEEFLKYQSAGSMQSDAYLLHLLLQIGAFGDEKEDEFMEMIKGFRSHVHETVDHALRVTTNSSPFKWNELLQFLSHLKEGDDGTLAEKEVDILHFQEEDSTSKSLYTSSEKQDENPSINDFSKRESLLQKFGLEKYYPAKITLNTVMAMDRISDGKVKSLTEVPWLILQRLIMLDPFARDAEYSQTTDQEINTSQSRPNEKTKQEGNQSRNEGDKDSEDDDSDIEDIMLDNETVAEGVNPLDVLLLIFYCSDLNLRQILLEKMFRCRLALPFIFPNSSSEDLCFTLWALRNIVIQWRNEKQETVESPAVSHPMNAISFVRLGRPQCSKSQILNAVLNDKMNMTFANISCSNGKTQRVLANGLIEASFHIPNSTDTEFLENVTVMLNLRGDARLCNQQVQILGRLSNAVVAFISKADLMEPSTIQTMKELYKNCSEVVLVLEEGPGTGVPRQQGTKELLDKYFSEFLSEKRCKKRNTLLGCDVKKLMARLKKSLTNLTTRSIEDAYQLVEEMVGKDESDFNCQEGIKYAEKLISIMSKKTSKEIKEEMLPLQGKYWQEWSQLLREEHRGPWQVKSHKPDEKKGPRENGNTIQEKGRMQKKMTELRKEQLVICNDPSPLIKTFITCLIDLIDTPSIEYFLQWLKLYFDQRSRETLPALHRDYVSKWKMYKDAKDQPNVENLEKEYKDAARLFRDESLGLENLFREVGQIYESAQESNSKLSEKSVERLKMLKETVAKLLLRGHSVELMDGDAFCVPVTWVKAVLECLHSLVGDKKLFTLSALGAQSSGKSTMLNTMFGLQLPVSAGRCTKGVYMQIVPVKEGSSLPFDYVVVLDTEGLQGSKSEDWRRDSELATFVVGLGDLTLMNVMGEGTSEMNDVLQIVVHALLRMKMVYKKVHKERSCMFIHQNVNAVDAKEKLMLDRHRMIESLDKGTKEAAKIEGTDGIQNFKDVISFDADRHVRYFSNPQNIVGTVGSANAEYHRNIQEVKSYILNDLIKDDQKTFDFKDLSLNIQDMWKGILQDNFVFSFRSSIVAKAYKYLETRFCDLMSNLHNRVRDWSNREVLSKFSRCSSEEDLKREHVKLLSKLDDLVKKLEDDATADLEKYFSTDEYRDIIYQWRQEKIKSLHASTLELKNNTAKDIACMLQKAVEGLEIKTKHKNFEKVMLTKAEKLGLRHRTSACDDGLLQRIFDDMWTKDMKDYPSGEVLNSSEIKESIKNELIKEFLEDGTPAELESMEKQLETPLRIPCLEESFNGIFLDDIKQQRTKQAGKRNGWKLVEWISSWIQDSRIKVLESVRNEVDCILAKLDHYLNDLKKVDQTFQPKHVGDMLKTLRKYFKGVSDNLKVDKALKIEKKLAVHVCQFALPVFQQMQDDSMTDKPKASKFTRKASMRKLFKSKVKQGRQEALFAEALCDRMEQLMSSIILQNISARIVDEIYLRFGTKHVLISSMLRDLANKADFEEFMQYIEDSTAYARKWLREFTNQNIFDGIYSKYQEFVMVVISEMFKKMDENIKKATEHINSTRDKTLQEWFSIFSADLDIAFSDIDEESFGHYCIDDFNHLQNILNKTLSEREKDMTAQYMELDPISIEWNGKSPYKQIMNKLWGCPEKCPFCLEPCKRSDANHMADNDCHQCVQHRPQGLLGTFWSDDDKLMVSNCGYNIQAECVFTCQCEPKCKDAPCHPYRDYKRYFPYWDIAPSPTMETSYYWMWVMATFKSQLMEEYNAGQPDIPESWAGISKERAKASLSDVF